jgi:hypothetical protein
MKSIIPKGIYVLIVGWEAVLDKHFPRKGAHHLMQVATLRIATSQKCQLLNLEIQVAPHPPSHHIFNPILY